MVNDEVMLSTIDNPFDYFTQFDQWLLYDKQKGYDCCEYLALIAKISDEMSQKEIDEEIERAVDEIVELNPLGIYTKVRRNGSNTPQDQ